MAPENAQPIIIWDFDRTILDGDCDRWVVLEMQLPKLLTQIRKTLSWNSLMDRMFEEMHSQGKTIDDFVTRLNRFTVRPEMISAIRKAHDLGCELKILSDANQFFIETILKKHGIFDCFSEIITNPTVVEKEGKLRVFPYYGSDLPPHKCKLCPPNLCKGLVINKIKDSDVKKRSMIYIGDGRDDLCATLSLRQGDHAMARENFILHFLLTKATVPINPKVHGWKDGEELNALIQLVVSPEVKD